MASCSDSSSNTTVTLTVTVGSTSTDTNSTHVSWTLTGRDSFGATWSGSPATGVVTVNSVHYSYSYNWSSPGTQTRTLESNSTWIPHNSDGTKTLTFGFTFGGIPGTSVGSMSATGSVVLPDIGPGKPTGLASYSRTQTSVQLLWAAGSGATPTSYSVEYSTSSTFASGNHIISGIGGSPFTVDGLASGISYYFRVQAWNGGVSSPWSSSISAATVPPTPAAPSLTTPQPGKLVAQVAPVTGATWYFIDISSSPTFATYTRQSVLPNAGYTFNMQRGVTYYVRALAQNSSGLTPASPTASAVVYAGGKRYDGSAFGLTTIGKRWNGSSWVDFTIAKKWNGTAWVSQD